MESKIETLVNELYSKSYAIQTDFLSIKEVNDLLSVLEKKQSDMKEAGIGKNENFLKAKEIRSDKIVWCDKNENEILDKLFFIKTDELILQLNRRCFLGLNNSEFHFAKYEPGAFYKRHRDAFSNDDARKVSLVLYLNKDWKEGDGGELNIYLETETIKVKPSAGTIVIFESHIEHEVMESKTNRYSITGWLKSEKLKF